MLCIPVKRFVSHSHVKSNSGLVLSEKETSECLNLQVCFTFSMNNSNYYPAVHSIPHSCYTDLYCTVRYINT